MGFMKYAEGEGKGRFWKGMDGIMGVGVGMGMGCGYGYGLGGRVFGGGDRGRTAERMQDGEQG
jgi:hypothetical protein